MALQKTVMRIDAGTLRPPVRLDNGFLRVDGLVARPGIFEYINTKQDEEDGLGKAGALRRELRTREEALRLDALAQYEGAPITIFHPKKMVDSKNVRALEVGSVTGPGRIEAGDVVGVSMMIKDAKAVSRVDSGELVELSPGYKCELVFSKGFAPEYATRTNPRGAYDFIQENVRVNHLALVDRARGGSDLRIRLDRADIGIRCSVERGDCGCGCACDNAHAIEEMVEKVLGIGLLVTNSVDGHQHTIEGASGRTSYSVSAGQDIGHDHAFVQNADGSYLILDNAGHSHALAPEPAPATETRLDGYVEAERKDRHTNFAGASQRGLDGIGPQVRPVAAGMRQGATTMDHEEQIRSLKAQLAESEKLADQRKVALSASVERADRAEATIKTLEDQARELETKIAAGTASMETEAIREQAERADRAEAVVRENEERFDSAVRERTGVIRRALVVMGEEFNPDRMSNREIQSIVVKRLDSGADISSKVTDAYVAGRFDSLCELHGKTARSLSRAGSSISGTRNDRAEVNPNAGDARAQRANDWRNQWKQPLPSARDNRNAKKEA